MAAQVTAMGIRDGDPAVLQALVNRRGSAVLAYCEQACAPSLALDAAAEAFSRFRATVLAATKPSDLDPEAALLGATRHAAASRSPRPPAREHERLPEVPELVVARQEGTITPEDLAALESLLAASPVARSIADRFASAESAYRATPRQPMPEPIVDQIVAAMGALAPPAAAAGNGAPTSTPLPAVPRFFRDPAEPEEPPVPISFSLPIDEAPAEEPEHAPEEPEVADDEEPETGEDVAPDSAPDVTPDKAEADQVLVDEAVPEDAEIAAARRADEVEPDATIEWSVPADELGGDPEIEHEIAAARLHEDDQEEDPAHLQSASGAVPLEDVASSAPPPPDPPDPPQPPAGAPGPPAHEHHGLPHVPRAALAPAAAVVTIAAIGALVASGIFGGNGESPPLDTGIVPERALQAVPEGETATIVDDLRSAAADARRRRLADQRQELAAQQLSPAEDDAEEDEDAAPADEEDDAAADEPAAETPAPEDEAPADEPPADEVGEVQPGEGGTSAEDATGGGAEPTP